MNCLQDTSGDETAKTPNLLCSTLARIRSLFGQGSGSWVCLVLVVAGFLLTLLDPSINLFKPAEEVGGGGPLANGNLYALHANKI